MTLVRARIEERSNLAELQRLDDRTLADIGLDRSMIYAAARGTIGGVAANWNNPMPVAANSNEPRAA
ncbi:MAG: DUF1127 domain-containing protein [Alphaproteobacteria bacterium]|nr:DUF1127 domain-containing protein [Alphaproteobacteria bacterium]